MTTTAPTDNNVIVINKQVLIQAALELEKQEAMHSFLLFHCLDQLEDIQRKLSLLLHTNKAETARSAFRSVFMSDKEWEKILTDQQIREWELEAKAKLEKRP